MPSDDDASGTGGVIAHHQTAEMPSDDASSPRGPSAFGDRPAPDDVGNGGPRGMGAVVIRG